MALSYDTITFLSDYGLDDEFVGIVHSVVRSIAPGIEIVDLTHNIRPYDVRAGGLALARSAAYLCPGVVVAVVDPGVGSDRRAVAVEVGEGSSVLVGPDNGLLAPAVALCGGADRAVALENEAYQLEAPGATFAGRDVFAPAAAHLANGVPLEELGPQIEPSSLLPGLLPVSEHKDGALVAEVLWVDGFGNAQLNVDAEDLDLLTGGTQDDLSEADPLRLIVGDGSHTAKRSATYAGVGAGQVGLVIDSYGLASVVVDQRSAATALGLHPGAEVRLESFGDDEQEGVAPPLSSPVELRSRPAGGDR